MRLLKITKILLLLVVAFTACKEADKSPSSSASQNVQATEPIVKAPEAKGSRRILFVGNSHTEYYISLLELFAELCKTNQQDFKVETVVEMGIALDEIYSARKSLITKAMSQKDLDGNYFDYVVLQEKTPVAIAEAEKYRANVKTFVDEIHKNSPGTVVLLYEVMAPADYKTEKADFDDYFAAAKKNALSVAKETPNFKLFRVGSAVKDAYEGKYGYVADKGGKDLLRHGEEGNLHMLNDAGFMAAVLLYETIFDLIPETPTALSLSKGVESEGETSLQEVNKTISNKDALMKIAFDQK